MDALSFIVFEGNAYSRARRMCEKLKDNIPRQLFEVPIQAAIGGKIIARETVKAMRKDVLAKCYGGDITRKKKLLEKQKEGKKRMRQLGSVEVPQGGLHGGAQAGRRMSAEKAPLWGYISTCPFVCPNVPIATSIPSPWDGNRTAGCWTVTPRRWNGSCASGGERLDRTADTLYFGGGTPPCWVLGG